MHPYRTSQRASAPRHVCARLSTPTVTSIFSVPVTTVGALGIIAGFTQNGWFLGLAAIAIAVLQGYVCWGHSAVAIIDEEDRALVIERWHRSTLREVERISLAEIASVTLETDVREIERERGMPSTYTVPRIAVNSQSGMRIAIRLSAESQRESARRFVEAVTAAVKRAAKKLR